MKPLLTAEQIDAAIAEWQARVAANLPDDQRIAIVGIRTRGETLARRMVEHLATHRPDLAVEFGILDITFYRDDLSLRRGAPLVRATEIDFDLDDCWVLLVDDVLQTGRSIRAALDALHDFGRPRVVRLAVLIDRGGRELPIQADYVGRSLDIAPHERISVRLRENDGEEGATLVKRQD
jgi:pyrimidine operon attenuation protein/uracil phosphoribosyltransferase